MSRSMLVGTTSRWLIGVLVTALLLTGCAGKAPDTVAGSASGAAERQPQSRATAIPGQAPAASAGTPLPKNAQGYADITTDQLEAMLAKKDFTLVNVHVPYAGELPQTDLFIPYDLIEADASKLPDKAATIVLYCSSGRMSTIAAETLVRLGYTNVMELDGGFSGWKAAGHELLSR